MESWLKCWPYLTSVVITVKEMMNWGKAITENGTDSSIYMHTTGYKKLMHPLSTRKSLSRPPIPPKLVIGQYLS